MLVFGASVLLLLQFASGLEQQTHRAVLARNEVVPQSHLATGVQAVKSGHSKRQEPCPSNFDPVVCPNGIAGCCAFGRVCVLIAGQPGCCPIGTICTDIGSCPVNTFQCTEALGGGCCPDGTTCSLLAGGSCINGGGDDPLPSSAACPTGSFRCAANLGGGCCKSGQTCAADGTCRVPADVDVDVSSSSPAATFRSDDTFSSVGAPATTKTVAAVTRTVTESVPAEITAGSSPISLSNAMRNPMGWELGGAVPAAVVAAAAVAVGLAAVL